MITPATAEFAQVLADRRDAHPDPSRKCADVVGVLGDLPHNVQPRRAGQKRERSRGRPQLSLGRLGVQSWQR